jgi:hypothetical protein
METMIPHGEGDCKRGLGGGFPVIWNGMAAMEGENFAGSGGERVKNGGVRRERATAGTTKAGDRGGIGGVRRCGSGFIGIGPWRSAGCADGRSGRGRGFIR